MSQIDRINLASIAKKRKKTKIVAHDENNVMYSLFDDLRIIWLATKRGMGNAIAMVDHTVSFQ